MMRALVIYESMFGNTHVVADAIGRGLRAGSQGPAEVEVVAVDDATPDRLAAADLVVVGGPTHGHGLSRPESRESAVAMAHKPDSGLDLDESAAGEGVREWLEQLPAGPGAVAAFDTRVDIPAVLSGRAAKAISKRLRKHGRQEVVEPESFLVTKDNHLEPGEEERAEAWGRALAGAAVLT
jgi:hypothetical protein